MDNSVEKINKGIYRYKESRATFEVVGFAAAPMFNSYVILIRDGKGLRIETLEEFNKQNGSEFEFIGFD